MREIFAALIFTTFFSSCATKNDPYLNTDPYADNAYNRAEAADAYHEAYKAAEYYQDPYGWSQGRQSSLFHTIAHGHVPTQLPE